MILLIQLALFLAATWQAPMMLGEFENPRIVESSGLAASRRNPGLYWTLNDSGGTNQIFLFDSRGRDMGGWTVTGARNRDWEALASGPGPVKGEHYLYVGDIGDNGRSRREVIVYRVPEPKLGTVRDTAPAQPIRLRYPDGPHDAEALLVHPRTADIYIVTKAKLGDGETGVYKGGPALRPKGPITMIKVAALDLPALSFDLSLFTGRVTGADVSPDGNRVVLSDYTQAYEAVLPRNRPFDAVWKQPWQVIGAGDRRQGEAVCYRTDGRAILLTSEGRSAPLLQILRN